MKRITLDTNILPAEDILASAEKFDWDVAIVSVTEREIEGSDLQVHLQRIQTVAEAGVYGEARYGRSRYQSTKSDDALDDILKIISNGSFPRSRTGLSDGHRRQLRDALIFEAHVRDHRDVFVTNDERAFVRDGRREKLEKRFGTRIMTSAEILGACKMGRL